MSDTAVRQVSVIGTGVIGASWAACFLARGLEVVATDPAAGAEEALRADIARHWPSLKSMGLAPGASIDNLTFTPDLEAAVRDTQFIQENGPEREDFKADLFRRIDAAAPPDAILASSSSGLLISRIQVACKHPERVMIGHPFNPPHLIPLVEVVGGDSTSAQAIEKALTFYSAIGKRPIHLRKEIAGHVANRLQAALWREAFHLVDIGVATVADIDTAIANGPGLRWALLGPFMNLHLSGGRGGMEHNLAHLGPAMESWWKELGDPSLTPELCRKVIDGVNDLLGDRSTEQIQKERDALLLDLLRAKDAAKDLP
jgi:carnitine 3-dehydrogenase